jgi:serine protease AprX
MNRIPKLSAVLILILWPFFVFSGTVLSNIYDADGDRIFENLKERLTVSRSSEKIPVIITYRDNLQSIASLSSKVQQAVSSKTFRRSFRNIPAVALSMTPDQIQAALKDPMIEQVELDGVMKKAMDGAKRSFGIDSVRDQFGFDGNRDTPFAYTTNDVVVAIIDTGINANHPDLKNKVLFFKDFVNNKNAPYDDEGHGTFVSGVLAGTGKINKSLAGVAPGAALVVFKVLDSTGSGRISDGIAAVDEAISRKAQLNIRILNLSLAVPGSSNGKDAFSQICNRAVANGITVVVAAGNEGPIGRSIGSPSAAASVITVGAGADLNEKGFYLADFSGRGPTADGRIKPDLWGPGVSIKTTRREGGYTSVNGTSFSTPFVSGTVALMLDANPNLTPAKIKSILLATAFRWFPGGKSNEGGFGRLQSYQAVTRAASITSNLQPPEVPSYRSFRASIGQGQEQFVDIPIQTINFPIAITCIILNGPSGDVDLDLLSPANISLSRSATLKRQETIRVQPLIPGVYKLKVSALAPTTYMLSISADSSNMQLENGSQNPVSKPSRELNKNR